MSDPWLTSLTDLMSAFRDGLTALIPVAERCRIPWRESESYDDWDEIEKTLYRTLVARSISWGLPEAPQDIRLAPWSMLVDSYANLDWIEAVSTPEIAHLSLVVVGFSILQEPFDHLRVRQVDRSGTPLSGLIRVPLEGTRFRFAWRQDDDRRFIKQLQVRL